MLALVSSLLSLPLHAVNISLAEHYFQQKNYPLAISEYKTAADIGNPRAYYQLGGIYYQGLGVDKDPRQALIWFSLAAEYDFEDSQNIVNQLIAKVEVEQQTYVKNLIATFQKKFGKSSVQTKYYPEINTENIVYKVSFANGEHFVGTSDFTYNGVEDFGFDDVGANDFPDMDSEDGFELASGYSVSSNSDSLNQAYLLVVDYDVAADGSRRDFERIDVLGNADKGIYQLEDNSLPAPTFRGDNVPYLYRSNLGIANYDKFRIRREFNTIRIAVKKRLSKAIKGNSPQDKYQQAMALMSFSWLKVADGQIDSLLKSAAESGYGFAQLEYGLKFYREQKNIPKAIYWISQAAKHGIARAEYRLGRIFLDSPWVITDERKALFWLESAAKKEHLIAIRKAAEIKLLAEDENLLDIDGAIDYLTQVAKQQQDNPDYHYLQAIVHISIQPRKLSVAVTNIREAIDLGEDLHWDVSSWQQQLKRWTSSGRVIVQDL